MSKNKHNLERLIWPDSCFSASDRILNIAGESVVNLVKKWGTPLYIFDEDTIRNQCQSYVNALKKYYPSEAGVHYASKAYSNLAIATLINSEKVGFDVVSSGELALALRAGVDPSSIHFHGNAKSDAELKYALDVNIGAIVIDNLDEIEALIEFCKNTSKVQKVLIRVTPNIGTDTHPHIQTGHRTSKFGLPLEIMECAVKKIIDCPNLDLAGLHFHLGSQIENTEPFVESLEILLDLYLIIKQKYGATLSEISPGGGLGVVYNGQDNPVSIEDFVRVISETIVKGCMQRGLHVPKLVLEPGRSIVARSCIALYSVIATKEIPGLNGDAPIKYIHIDGGMGDNIRPSLYGSKYSFQLANRANDGVTETVNVSGRYCESGDILLKNISMPEGVSKNDIVAVAGVGAYTLSMASNYNMVPRPSVLLAGKQNTYPIQKRETEDDLFSRDLPLIERTKG